MAVVDFRVSELWLRWTRRGVSHHLFVYGPLHEFLPVSNLRETSTRFWRFEWRRVHLVRGSEYHLRWL